ncbi:MAG: hypothetical protein M0R32_03485 [Candidatus Cloacimonetes bacterium]|jgi:hypothetical protein|nr:hypothetical protein [Candidatus Cloacimonadota bacterium]
MENQKNGDVVNQIKQFKLTDRFLAKYKEIIPPFGFNGLGYLVYMRTYSRMKDNGENEMWWETVQRVVEGTYHMQQDHMDLQGLAWDSQKAQRSAQEMYDRIFNMKFLPPGRGLWAMGSPLTEEKGIFAALNNCFAGSTRFVTREGLKTLEECAGTKQIVLTKNGAWVESEIKEFGKQKLMSVTLSRQGQIKKILATPDHIWFAKSPSEINHNKGFGEYSTKKLKPDYRLQYMFGQQPSGFSPQGVQHGICFGDGTRDHLYLCGDKNKNLAKWFPLNRQSDAIEKDAIRVADLPSHFKNLPDINSDRKYLLGWLMGYFAADGTVGKDGTGISLASSSLQNLKFAQDVANIIGIGTYDPVLNSESSNYKESRELWKMNFIGDTIDESFFLVEEHKNRFKPDTTKRNWHVVEILPAEEDYVYCAVVPDYEAFTIEGNILTHNCAFVSTENIKEELARPFAFLMDASMLGVGVGFDTKGKGQLIIKGPNPKRQIEKFVISDTREGWVESLKLLLESYFLNTSPVEFDYSQIRLAGTPIRGFGGVASGPDPLIELHKAIREILDAEIGKEISTTVIVDIMNLIGKCVVAGNVRRTAEIVFGETEDEDYLDLKNYKVNPHREEFGWTSNNSIFAKIGMDYSNCAERTRLNGEPGYAWLDNMRSYSRMNNGPDNKDHRASGGNPCLEQTLESMELCCLVETFPDRHTDLDDYKKTLKFAYLYAKTVTLGKTHWPETNRVMLRNRRIGCSMSGVAQFITNKGLHQLKTWCEEGYNTIQYYDQVYSDWLAIPRSIKTTSIKPSGTVSLLAGSTPGMHYPESRFYIRRVRLAINSPLQKPLKKAGYKIEPCVGSEESTVVVEIPVDVGEGIRTIRDVGIWEQFSLAAFLQKYWADNQVSCTVTFDPSEGNQIEPCLNYFQYQLKGISLLPRHEGGAYPQMPYEKIEEGTYNELCKKLKKLDFSKVYGNEAEIERFCDGEACTIEIPTQKEAD